MTEEAKESGNTSAGRIFLHPLPLVSISEHHARAENGGMVGAEERVIGALFGKQEGLDIHIADSYELVLTPEGRIDVDFLNTKRNLIMTVFPDYEVVGLYSTAQCEGDMAVMETMAEYNAHLFLLLDPNPDPESKTLPITISRREVVLQNDRACTVMVQVPFDVDSTEPERVVVDHVSKVSAQPAGASTLVTTLKSVRDAVVALKERVHVLKSFVRASKDGAAAPDHALLRQISSICSMLPAVDADEFHSQFLAEYNDSLLVTYLSNITQSLKGMDESVSKFRLANERARRGASRGMALP